MLRALVGALRAFRFRKARKYCCWNELRYLVMVANAAEKPVESV